MSPLYLANWERILDIRGLAELFIGWRLHDGRCHFWYDNWTGHEALYLRVKVREDISFQHVMENGEWVTWRLTEVLPVDMVLQVLVVASQCKDSPDRMI